MRASPPIAASRRKMFGRLWHYMRHRKRDYLAGTFTTLLYAGLFVTTSPILIKAALEMIGLIPSARLRLPLVEATPVQRDILRTVLERRGILSRA